MSQVVAALIILAHSFQIHFGLNQKIFSVSVQLLENSHV